MIEIVLAVLTSVVTVGLASLIYIVILSSIEGPLQ